MFRAAAVAGFATDAIFRRHQRFHAAGGMAGKAAVNPGHRIPNAVEQTRRFRQVRRSQTGMARCGPKGAQLGEIAEIVFQIEARITAADESDGLLPRAERPFHRYRQHVRAIIDAQRKTIEAETELAAPHLSRCEWPKRP